MQATLLCFGEASVAPIRPTVATLWDGEETEQGLNAGKPLVLWRTHGPDHFVHGCAVGTLLCSTSYMLKAKCRDTEATVGVKKTPWEAGAMLDTLSLWLFSYFDMQNS